MRFNSFFVVFFFILLGAVTQAAPQTKKRAILAPDKTKKITLKTVLNSVVPQQPSDNGVPTPALVVTPSIIASQDQNRLVAVRVSGNRQVSDSLIVGASLLPIGEELNPFRISRAVKNIQSLGLFSDVRSEVTRSELGRTVTFYVVENPRVGSIEFRGVTAFKPDKLMKSMSTQVGDLVSLIHVRKDLRAIEAIYLEAGYDSSKVVSFVPPAKDGDPLIFVVAEGILERVEVTGNTKTQSYVILREMVSKPGEPLNKLKLRQDYQRINNLGYFASVVPEVRPGVSANSAVLVWDIEERENSGTFTMGGGFSPTGGFSFFSDVYWDNLFGTGQLVSAKAQLGRLSTYELKYSNPWVWDERKSITARTWFKDGQVDQFLPNSNGIGYRDEQSQGVSLELGWPFSYEFGSFHTVKYESVVLRDVDKEYTLTSYTLGLNYDTRDVRFNPLSGELYTLRIEKSFVLYASSLDMTRIDLDLRHYFKVAEQQTIATRLLLGYLTSPQISDEDLFLREFYRVGGSNSVRGWNDYYPFSIGNKQVLTSIEYRYVFNDMFQAVGFVDGGFATRNSVFDLNQYRIGKGIGVRFTVPMLGPIRLDWAFGDQGDSFVHVSIGHAF